MPTAALLVVLVAACWAVVAVGGAAAFSAIARGSRLGPRDERAPSTGARRSAGRAGAGRR